jgi:hypothetical protein
MGCKIEDRNESNIKSGMQPKREKSTVKIKNK